jgi:cytochrome c oxidase subunit 3
MSLHQRMRHNDPERAMPARPEVGRAGMWIFIVALSVLFLAGIVAHLLIRFQQPVWPPAGVPSISVGGLLVSTLILLASSATLVWAHTGVMQGNQRALRNGLLLTFLLGLAFLVAQGFNWSGPISEYMFKKSPADNSPRYLYSFLFYAFTWVHAAHVVGGLILLWVVWRKAARGLYSGVFHPGVSYSSIYWHFLGVVWIVLFTVLTTTM